MKETETNKGRYTAQHKGDKHTQTSRKLDRQKQARRGGTQHNTQIKRGDTDKHKQSDTAQHKDTDTQPRTINTAHNKKQTRNRDTQPQTGRKTQ